MAEAYGKLTGKPGIVMVTRGPGATNASIGIHTAYQDSTPLIMFIGQVARDCMDPRGVSGNRLSPHVRPDGQMGGADRRRQADPRIPEPRLSYRGFRSARPGGAGVAGRHVARSGQCACCTQVSARRRSADSGRTTAIVRVAGTLHKRPLAILGGSGWTPQACADLRRFAEAWQLPVACAFRFQDLFDNTHPLYAGDVGIGINPKLAQRVKDADLLLAIGPRLGEMTTSGYSLV